MKPQILYNHSSAGVRGSSRIPRIPLSPRASPGRFGNLAKMCVLPISTSNPNSYHSRVRKDSMKQRATESGREGEVGTGLSQSFHKGWGQVRGASCSKHTWDRLAVPPSRCVPARPPWTRAPMIPTCAPTCPPPACLSPDLLWARLVGEVGGRGSFTQQLREKGSPPPKSSEWGEGRRN